MLRLLSADAAAVKAVILSLSPRFNAIAMTDITQNDGLLIFTILKHLSPSGQSFLDRRLLFEQVSEYSIGMQR